MPAALTYPGVYIQEVPSGVRTITGVATSITAFVGRAAAGATNEPTMLTSFADYERQFGGLEVASPMSYAVRDFYLNGGTLALIVRVVHDDAATATITLAGDGSPSDDLVLEASSAGAWGNRLSAAVDHDTDRALPRASPPATNPQRFNLTVRYRVQAGKDNFVVETFGAVVAPQKSGYNFTLGAGAGSAAGPNDCNGTATITAYLGTAIPQAFGTSGGRSFSVNAGNTIWQNNTNAAPTEPFGAPATPIQ